MNTVLDLTASMRARVWLNELPSLVWQAKRVAEYRVQSVDQQGVRDWSAGLEVAIRAGPRTLYGLLGARFCQGAGELVVRIPVEPLQVMPIPWSLVAPWDTAYAGLPAEYEQSVLSSVIDSKILYGRGSLTFETSAFTDVGSSENMFQRLARTVVMLPTLHNDSPSDVDIARLIFETWPIAIDSQGRTHALG